MLCVSTTRQAIIRTSFQGQMTPATDLVPAGEEQHHAREETRLDQAESDTEGNHTP